MKKKKETKIQEVTDILDHATKMDRLLLMIGDYMGWKGDISHVFVSDLSQLGDFMLGEDKVRDLSERLRFKVRHKDYLVDIVKKMMKERKRRIIMSHVAEIQLEVNDLNALESACKTLGLELVRGQQTYRWWGHSVGDFPLPKNFSAKDLGKCEHAIRIPNNKTAYEIGVVRSRDGVQNGKTSYQLLWDFYAGGYGMQEKVGLNANKLKQAYAAARAKKQLSKQGMRVRQKIRADGTIVLAAS